MTRILPDLLRVRRLFAASLWLGNRPRTTGPEISWLRRGGAVEASPATWAGWKMPRQVGVESPSTVPIQNIELRVQAPSPVETALGIAGTSTHSAAAARTDRSRRGGR